MDALVADVQGGGLSPRELVARAGGVREAFLGAYFPPDLLQPLRAKVEAVFPGVAKLKVRSSANAEDIPGFDGAGLHDSYSVKTKVRDEPCQQCRVEVEVEEDGEVNHKVDPRSLACAVRAVYASLWNRRAIDERWFARIDQTTVAMGLALVAAYDTESEVVANAVVITRVLNTDAVYGYSLSLQSGNNLVTNPTPGTHSEVTIAAFISDEEPISFTTTRFAKPDADAPALTSPVLSAEAMTALVDLVRTVERAYCAAEPDYYPGDCGSVTSDNTKPRSLDLEVKVLANGQFVIKQVREFGGR
ncbi:MAG: PEP/pyruvate-binding domain-containing protein [Actinomycetes bacterium]